MKKTIIEKPNLKKNEVIAIVMASSNQYSDYLLVSMMSIKRNSSKRRNYEFVILSDGICKEKKEIIWQTIATKNIAVRFVDAESFIEGRYLRTEAHVTKTTYLRLACIDIMHDYSKVIYLDCDTVTVCDIATLYDTDITGYSVAAVKDSIMLGWCHMDDSNGQEQEAYLKNVLKIVNVSSYFNAGVMLLNIHDIRKQGISSTTLIDIASSRQWKWFDQDVLNFVFRDKVLYLDNTWNVMAHVHEHENDIAEYYSGETRFSEYLYALSHPKIIHYAGNAIPILHPSVDRSDLFWKYARYVHIDRELLFENWRNQETMVKNSVNHIYTLEEFDIFMGERKKSATEIKPAFNGKSTVVSIVSSDEYCPFAAVVLEGIIENSSRNNNYDIVILTNDMLQRNICRLESMSAGQENISIRVFDISEMVKGLSFYTWAHFTSNTYYRLLTPDLFTHYDKVLYLDSDIAINHDIAELFNIDISEFYLACAYDTHVVSYCTRKPPLEQRDYNIKTLGMQQPEKYFQAGVSLFNVKKIREECGEGFLIKKGTETKLRWLDQDLINMLFQGYIKLLPNKWNVMVSNNPDNLDEFYLPDVLRNEYFEARKNPYIVHYVGRSMPCYTSSPDLYEYFWKYAKNTVFYEILLQRMMMDYAEKLKMSIIHEARNGIIKMYPNRKKRLYMDLLQYFPLGTKRRTYLDKFFT